MAKIIYTFTDEAPMLATYSFLPVIEAGFHTPLGKYFSFDLSDPTIALLHAGEGSRADDGGALSRGERWLFERTHQ